MKNFKLLILVFIIHTGILGCICNGDYEPFWGIEELELSFKNGDGEVVQAGIIHTDTLTILVDMRLKYLSAIPFTNPFINSSMATSCPNDGEEGLKTSVSSMVLTSDAPFLDKQEGESLNQYVFVKIFGELKAITPFLSEYLNDNSFPLESFEILIVEKPTEEKHNFTLELQHEGEMISTAQSSEVRWR